MSTITLSRKEYKELKSKATKYEAALSVPAYNLKGKEATKLDRRVEKSLREYRAGKSQKIRSSADL